MIFAGLDIETTGLEFGDHRLVEVCVQLWDTDGDKLLDDYVQRINPQRSILADAQRVHGISLADLDRCPIWDVVAPKIHDLIGKSAFIVAHNGVGFDMPFLNYELKRVKLPALTQKCFDTMLHGRGATHNGKSPTLGELCFAFGVEYDTSKAHAADYDVECMVQCFLRGVRWGYFEQPLNLILDEKEI